jgi:NinB protein
MPVTIVLAEEINRQQAIKTIQKAASGTRVCFSDPALTEAQLTLLRIILSDIVGQSERDVPKTSNEWQRLLSAACFCDQGLPGFEPNTWVVCGCLFEELTVAQACDMIEFLYLFGARNDVTFREKKTT